MSVFYRAVLYFLVAWPIAVQSQAFEKITIKPARSTDPRSNRMQVLPNGDLIATAVPVIELLSYAYGVPSNPSPRLNSLPGWTVGDSYDIEAKAPASAIAASSQDSEAQARLQQMIRRLLADRFRLVMRVEHERMSAYALTVSASGPKLQKSAVTAKDCIFDTAPEGCHHFVIGFGHPLDANAISTDDLAHYVENWTDLPVVDHTNLSGFVHRTHGRLATDAAATAATKRQRERELRKPAHNFHGSWQARSRTASARGNPARIHRRTDRTSFV